MAVLLEVQTPLSCFSSVSSTYDQSNEKLAAHVEERSAELVNLSDQLQAEVIERRRAEEAAREGEARLRRLIESTQVIPWEADATTWRFTYVGPQATALGYPLESWCERDFWVDHIHADDREATVNFCASQAASGGSYEFDHQGLLTQFEDRNDNKVFNNNGTLTVADGFTNAGSLVLTAGGTTTPRHATVAVTNGALVNTGTITSTGLGR